VVLVGKVTQVEVGHLMAVAAAAALHRLVQQTILRLVNIQMVAMA
jgi:hypothetical protein